MLRPVAFSLAAIAAYSRLFASPFAIPKLMVLAIGLLYLSYRIIRGAPVNLGGLTRAGVVLILVCLASALQAEEPWLALVGRYNSYAMGLIGLLVVLLYHIASDGNYDHVPLVGAIIGLHALAQWAGFDNAISSTLSGNRAISTLGSPVDLGIILAMILPLAVKKSWVYSIAIILGLAACGSRGAVVAAGVGVLVNRHSLYAVLALGLAAMALFGARPLAVSDGARLEAWRTALKPSILGIGPDGFGNQFRRYERGQSKNETTENAHNDFLQALATIGIVGLVTYSLFVLQLFKSISGPVLGSIAALFINAKFNPVPLEAMVLAAILCSGNLRSKISGQWRGLFVLASIGIFFFASKLTVADFYAKRGNFKDVETACKINPNELAYKVMLINRGVYELNHTHDLGLKSAILNSLRRQATQALTLRPNSATSWKIAYTEAVIEQELGIKRNPSLYLRSS